MRPFAFQDSDAPIGASRLDNRPGEPPLARPAGNAWKPFAGAAAIALVAAGMATLLVQSLGSPAPTEPAADRPAPERTASISSQPVAPAADSKPSVVVPQTSAAPPAPPAPSGAAPLQSASQPAPTAANALPAQPVLPPSQAPAPAPAQVASIAPAPELPAAPVTPAPVPSIAQAEVPSPAAAPAAPAPETGSLNLSSEEVLTSLERGEAKLKAGDVAAARRYFERVALAGDARGATAMGRTFDPEVLLKLPVIGLEPDPAQAEAWYAKARTLKAGP
ncbi:hypothetical protein SLNSH_09500 [Alsobacter soli]|uniref:Uncharacterized protein n=1 Tax=Alsobacter soli TaxID=2109933 RepID=A0A2T1HUS2_9HYPH|nr:hypothetical protein [Alsobacter soli]PSC05416.1 hypothetical protein SLNSH_09500 [Alsobacter soli]